MKKIILVLSLMFVVTGCSKNDLKDVYKEMDIKKIESYSIDLRVNGTYKEERINDSVRITNNEGEQIIYRQRNNNPILTEDLEELEESMELEYVYENDKMYKLTDRKYEETKETVKYKDVELLLQGLKEVKKVNDETEEKIGETTYKVYEVIMKDKYMEKLLNSYGFKQEVDGAKGKIYVNEDRVHRLIYEAEDLKINALYFSIGQGRTVDLEESI